MHRSAMSLDLLASLSRPNVIREDLPKHHLVIIKINIQDNHRKEYQKKNRNVSGSYAWNSRTISAIQKGVYPSPLVSFHFPRSGTNPSPKSFESRPAACRAFDKLTPSISNRTCPVDTRAIQPVGFPFPLPILTSVGFPPDALLQWLDMKDAQLYNFECHIFQNQVLFRLEWFRGILKRKVIIKTNSIPWKEKGSTEERKERDGCFCCSREAKIIRLANEVGQPLFGFGQTLFLAGRAFYKKSDARTYSLIKASSLFRSPHRRWFSHARCHEMIENYDGVEMHLVLSIQ
ncbi:hypothetical protein CR513_00681, partial [Mucuna pruriens]